MSFSSDGASMMLGRNNGVAAKLANKNPYLFVSHCIAHRLALACNSAQKRVTFCKYIENLIKETYPLNGKTLQANLPAILPKS